MHQESNYNRFFTIEVTHDSAQQSNDYLNIEGRFTVSKMEVIHPLGTMSAHSKFSAH